MRNPFKLWKYEIRNTSFYYEKFVQGRHLIRAWIFHFEGKLHRRVQETRTCTYSCIQCGHKWASKLRPEAITSLVRSSWSLRAYIISVSPKIQNHCHILIHTVFNTMEIIQISVYHEIKLRSQCSILKFIMISKLSFVSTRKKKILPHQIWKA